MAAVSRLHIVGKLRADIHDHGHSAGKFAAVRLERRALSRYGIARARIVKFLVKFVASLRLVAVERKIALCVEVFAAVICQHGRIDRPPFFPFDRFFHACFHQIVASFEKGFPSPVVGGHRYACLLERRFVDVYDEAVIVARNEPYPLVGRGIVRGIDQSVVKIGEKFFVPRKLALVRQILKISRSRIGRMLVARRPYDIGQLACGSPVDDLSHSAHVFGDFNGNFGILFLESVDPLLHNALLGGFTQRTYGQMDFRIGIFLGFYVGFIGTACSRIDTARGG